MLISNETIIYMIITIIICFGVPIAGVIIVSRKSKYMLGAFLAGSISFFVTQIVIRIPLVQLIMVNLDLKDTLLVNILISISLASTAALFESAGRLASMKWLMTEKRRGYFAGISHGLGHGGIEAIMLVGLNYILYLVIGISMAKGDGAYAIIGSDEASIEAMNVIFSNEPIMFLMAGLERLFTMMFHVAMSLLIMEGFVKQKIGKYFVIVLICHTALDFSAVMLSYLGIDPMMIEGFIGLVAVASVIVIIQRKHAFGDNLNASDEGENAVKEGY